jgi:hypothetical protein
MNNAGKPGLRCFESRGHMEGRGPFHTNIHVYKLGTSATHVHVALLSMQTFVSDIHYWNHSIVVLQTTQDKYSTFTHILQLLVGPTWFQGPEIMAPILIRA